MASTYATATALLFATASNEFTPIVGKPTDDDIFNITKVLYPLLHNLKYDEFIVLAPYVADVSPTLPNVAKSWPTLCVVTTQKRPRHTQFISIKADKYKSVQTYEYYSYHIVFVFELKQQSCRDMSPTRHRMSPFWQQKRHADI